MSQKDINQKKINYICHPHNSLFFPSIANNSTSKAISVLPGITPPAPDFPQAYSDGQMK